MTFLNDKATHLTLLAYFLGLVPFLNIKNDSLQVPVYSE